MGRKSFAFLCIGLLIASSAFAEVSYKMRSNPQTGRGDWVINPATLTGADLPALEIPAPDLSLYAQKTEAFLLDQSVPQTITGLSDGYLKLTSGVIGTGAIDVSGLVAKTDAQTIKVDGDFYGHYLVSSTKKISPTDLGYGYTITRVVVQAATASPTTQFRGDLKRCDAQGTGAFPGANPAVIKVLDTTTGNYDSGVIAEDVATGKELYIQMDSNVDYGVMWTITITYQLKTS